MALTQYVKTIYHQKFPALTHKDFRIYWLGQAVSLLGSWMQNIGLTWIATSLMESALLILISFTRVSYLTTIFLVGCGIFNIWFETTASSMLQLTSKDEYRGRITSVYTSLRVAILEGNPRKDVEF